MRCRKCPTESSLGKLIVGQHVVTVLSVYAPQWSSDTIFGSGSCHTVKGKDTRYKLYWSVNNKGTTGVGVFVAKEWID